MTLGEHIMLEAIEEMKLIKEGKIQSVLR